MIEKGNFTIYRSSAGSGKTYILSLNYIAISILGASKNKIDYYSKILAITFTNKAASEMKSRILRYLDILSQKKDQDSILSWLKKETKLSKDKIYLNAKKVRDHMLHNYSNLSISTIDKFTYRLVRSFAKDLSLSQNFELEMDSSKIIQPVVASIITKISASGDLLSNALVKFALDKAEDGKSYNIESDLEVFCQQLFKEQSIKHIEDNAVSIEKCDHVRKLLKKEISNFENEIKKISNEALLFLNEKGIEPNHFSRKSYYKYFSNNILTFIPDKMLPSNSLQKQIVEKQLYTNQIKSNSKYLHIKKMIDENIDELFNFYFSLQNFLQKELKNYISNKAIERNIHSMMVLQELIKENKHYKDSKNIEQISDFNKKIHKLIRRQFSSFIYERIGSRYRHYLLDEFQDTSILQWQNLLPLITDSLDYGKSLVVGDGKQSIYRWRGGEVEQFLNLPTIYKGDNLELKTEWEQKLVFHEKIENLKDNFRSKKEIIKFNNMFYDKLKHLLSKDLINIYKNHDQGLEKSKKGGYVHIELLSKKDIGFKEQVCKRVISEIRNLVDKHNYKYQDISILCNSRKRVSLIAEKLMSADIDVVSNEGLLLSKSKKVNLFISTFQYLHNQEDSVSKTVILQYLNSESNIDQINITSNQIDDFLETLKDFNISFTINRLLKLPLYQLLQRIKRKFKIQDDLYVQFFEDVVFKYEQENGSCLGDFLIWWQDAKSREAITMPDKINAVQVMTIHKSKGLAFNVVIIPFNWEDRKNSDEIWVDSSKLLDGSLPAALINTSQTLSLSHFSDRYQKEQDLNLLDNLNKLYVATTRAKERLYIFAKEYPKSDNFTTKGYLNSFLHAFGKKYPYSKGKEAEKHISKEESKGRLFFQNSYKKAKWKKIISLKHTASKHWDTENHLNKVDWGNLLHIALSEIHHINDKKAVVNRLYASGQCTKEEKERLMIEIDALFECPDIKNYFTGDWEIKTEKEILLSSGKTYIPDCLLFKNRDVVILDYKTGVRKKEHLNQINNYASIMQKMGYKILETKLIYTKDYLKK